MDVYTTIRSAVTGGSGGGGGGTVLVPAPNLGTAEPPLAIIHNLRASPAAAAVAAVAAAGGKNASVGLNHRADSGATLSRVLPEQNLSEYRPQVPPTTTTFNRKTASGDMHWRWSKKRSHSNTFPETWRIQNASMMELLDKQEAEMEWKSKKQVAERKAAKAKHKSFTPRAFTLGGKRIEPIHSDEVWFLERLLRILAMIFFVITLPFSLMFCFKVVAHYERAVVFRLGRLFSSNAQGPGLIFLLPCLDNCRVVDLRTFTFNVPTQEVLTKDSLTVAVNAVVYYRIRNPVCAVVNVEDANRSTRLLGQTTLRNVLGTVNLDELLTAREDIAILMQECLDSVTEAWGVKVERVEIKDVRLPIQLQRAMAAEAEAAREATAKVIAAEGEMRASSALKFAALEISQHPIAVQLRYLQTLNTISSGKESTIVFPVPIEMLKFFKEDLNGLNFHLNPTESEQEEEEGGRASRRRSTTSTSAHADWEFGLNNSSSLSAERV
nr:unnamed protein product [Spirometra erinaceieuropaei]